MDGSEDEAPMMRLSSSHHLARGVLVDRVKEEVVPVVNNGAEMPRFAPQK